MIEAHIAFLKAWHGEHNPEKCDIARALIEFEDGNITIEHLFQIADDVDEQWKDAFEHSIQNEQASNNAGSGSNPGN